MGEEVARGPDRRGVVAEVGDQGLNQLGSVTGIVVDDGLEGLAVEGFELLGVLLEHPEEELVGARPLEGRDGGGTVDAVPDLESHSRFGVGVREEGRVLFVASDPDGDRQVREETLYVALYTLCQQLSLLRQLVGTLAFGRTQEEYDVVRAGAEEEVREELAGLQAHRVGQAPLQLLYDELLRSAALQVTGEVVDVHDQDEGAAREVGAEVLGALQEELHRAVVPVYEVVHEVAPDAELRLQAYALLAELGLQDAPGPVQAH